MFGHTFKLNRTFILTACEGLSVLVSRVWCNGCVLCRRIKRESILSLCEPRTLFKGFNQNPIKKKHWLWDDGTRTPF